MMRRAVFAGTSEGHELLALLSRHGMPATAFVATEYGAELICDLPGIEVRQGRLDADEMRVALAGFDVVVDATHPYATVVSANLRDAARLTDTRYIRLLRPSSLNEELADAGAPRVIEVADAQEAAERLSELDGGVLLTTGSKDLPIYTQVRDYEERLFVRILPVASGLARALALGYPAKHIICMLAAHQGHRRAGRSSREAHGGPRGWLWRRRDQAPRRQRARHQRVGGLRAPELAHFELLLTAGWPIPQQLRV